MIKPFNARNVTEKELGIKHCDNIGKETYEVEFKEFSLKHDILVDQHIMASVLNNVVFDDFDNIMLRGIQLNLFEYLPKYISCFSNPNAVSSSKKGKLFLGVDDNGNVTGIPLTTDISVDLLMTFVYEQVRHMINEGFIQGSLDTSSNIHINISKLDKPVKNNNFLLAKRERYLKSLDRFNANLNKHTDCKNQYEKDRHRWLLERSRYDMRFDEMVKDSSVKGELIRYINSKNFRLPSKPYEKGKSLKKLGHITLYYDDYVSISSEFRSKRLREIDAEFKPDKVRQYNCHNPLKYMIKSVTPLISNYAYSKDINYYLIEVQVRFNKDGRYRTVLYNDGDKLSSRKRIIKKDGEPACV